MSKYRQDEERLTQLATGYQRAWKQFFDENLDAFLGFTMKYAKVSREESFNLYQEALVILHRNVTENKLGAPLRSSLQTYLLGIAKNLCRRKGSSALVFPENIPDVPQNPIEEETERKHLAALVRNLLNKIGEKCRQFLTLVFLEEQAQQDIMDALNIPSDEAFRKRKHDCLKKMREFI
jgi:RNA polymerase sigma factor (sigma-70 family)